jgi:membrane dipeptidase
MFDLTKEQEKRAKNIHSESLVVDTHNDTILDLVTVPPFLYTEGMIPKERRKLGERSEIGQIDLPRIKDGGINCLFFAMYVSPQYNARLRRLVQMLDAFHSEIEKNSNQIVLATTYPEVIDAANNDKVAAILSVEGGEPLEGDLGVLRMLYKLGVRSLTLTHFPRNELADGSGADSSSHLTNFGSMVVEEMNELGMLVDISHINETGFWDVIELSKDPIIASHSNCKALCSHHRNLTDEQIKAMAEKGGVLNLSFCGGFIKNGVGFGSPDSLRKVTINDWLDHLDHAVNLVGTDHVGVGSDFDGGCGFPGMDDISKVPDITRGMIARGYSNNEIEKILGGNNLRVMSSILK